MLLRDFVLARGHYISPALHFISHSVGNSRRNNKNKTRTTKKEIIIIQIQVKQIIKTMLAPQK